MPRRQKKYLLIDQDNCATFYDTRDEAAKVVAETPSIAAMFEGYEVPFKVEREPRVTFPRTRKVKGEAK